MAIEDALAVIDQTWPEIEPRLTVREIAELADIGYGPADKVSDLTELVFFVVVRALPPDHAAWSALRSSGTRFSPGVTPVSAEELLSRYITRAQAALARPSIIEDAAADFLVEAMERIVLRSGVTTEKPVTEAPVLSVNIDRQRVYPLFQFASLSPTILHGPVWRLTTELGGSEDPLGAIGWWLSPNTWLGQAPAQLLGAGRDAEIEYAAAQLRNDSW
jgi:hypothetical protein